MRKTSIFATIFLFVCSNFSLMAQAKDAPASIAAAMVMKVVAFEKTLGAGGDITIYVVGAEDVAAELKKAIGKPIGKATLKSVESGADLPANKPSVLFVGDPAKFDAATAYTKSNKVLSVTGSPDLVSKGVTLGFGVGDDNKPKILLNLSASSEEGMDWNPAILKVAKTI